MPEPETTVSKTTKSIGTRANVYHPDYGLADDYRREILRCAERTDVASAAAAYNVSASSIYRWRKDMTKTNPAT